MLLVIIMLKMINLQWTTFSLIHIITIIFSFIVFILLYFLLINKNERIQKNILFPLSLFGWSAILYNLLAKDNIYYNLPLQLCSINAMLLPVLMVTNNKTLGNVMPIMAVGAFGAIVLNFGANYSIFSYDFLFYYWPHLMEALIPWLLVMLGKIQPELKYIWKSIFLIFIFYTIAYAINSIIVKYTKYSPNYMFCMRPENIILEVLWNICPYEYLYMLLTFPIVVGLCFLYNLKNLINLIKKKCCR